MRAGQLYVDGDSVQLGDTLITICPWWDGPASRLEVESLLTRDAQKSKQRWIWIHHSPPDRSPVSWAGKNFGGDEFLVSWIQKYQPHLVFSGHIHNAPFNGKGSWHDRIGKTWVFNPGRQIGPRPAYLIYDLEAMSVEWVSLEGQELQKLTIPSTGRTPPTTTAAAGA